MTTAKRPRPTRRRAPNGRGSFSQEPDGTWRGWISFGNDPITGKRIRGSARGRTYAEVAAQVEKLQDDYAAGNLTSGGGVSVQAWLRHWLAICIERQAPATVNRKEWAIHNWLIPTFEDVTLDQLDPELIEKRPPPPRHERGPR